MLQRLRLVHAVTGGARESARFVRAPFPAGVRDAVVTRQTRAVGVVDVCRPGSTESPDVPLGVVVDVGLAGTVTALAAKLRDGRARIVHLTVLGGVDARLVAGIVAL